MRGPVLADTRFHTPKNPLYPAAQVIEGVAEVNGKPASLCIRNGFFHENNIELIYGTGRMNGNDDYMPLSMAAETVPGLRDSYGECALTEREAIRIGEELLAALGIADMMLDSAEPAVRTADGGGAPLAPGDTPSVEILGRGWSLDYTRIFRGVPVTRTKHYGHGVPEEGAPRPWPYERLHITLAEDGTVAFFEYASPYAVGDLITERTAMLPFSEIASVFQRMAPLPYSYMQEDEIGFVRRFVLTEVRLGLMRITEKTRRDMGMLIPVWDFMADYEDGAGYINHDVVLTINAIDGTVIDRHLGY